jgi:hypothetical protein
MVSHKLNDHKYFQKELNKFTLLITKDLENIEIYGNFFDYLNAALLHISSILPDHVLKVLHTVKIYINKEYYYNNEKANGCCVHRSSGWLIQNGNLAEKEGHVEIYDAIQYTQWIREQPSMLFHELVHAYEHREGSRVVDDINEVYNKVMKTGKYDSVKYIYGQEIQHYCKNNAMEYLAETSEAFFSTAHFRNDFYPFIHTELKEYDPDGYNMIIRVFKLDDEWLSNFIANFKTPIDYDPVERKRIDVVQRVDKETGYLI